jgi:hypothetical protein
MLLLIAFGPGLGAAPIAANRGLAEAWAQVAIGPLLRLLILMML